MTTFCCLAAANCFWQYSWIVCSGSYDVQIGNKDSKLLNMIIEEPSAVKLCFKNIPAVEELIGKFKMINCNLVTFFSVCFDADQWFEKLLQDVRHYQILVGGLMYFANPIDRISHMRRTSLPGSSKSIVHSLNCRIPQFKIFKNAKVFGILYRSEIEASIRILDFDSAEESPDRKSVTNIGFFALQAQCYGKAVHSQ